MFLYYTYMSSVATLYGDEFTVMWLRYVTYVTDEMKTATEVSSHMMVS